MAENPFTQTQEFEYKQFAVAYLPNLKYLDYELIEKDFRVTADEKYREEIQEKDNQKAAEKEDDIKGKIDPELV